jgi:hypothetical protein
MVQSGIPLGTSFFPLNFEVKKSARELFAEPSMPATFAGLTERSLFHEPWWLDITTGGNWALAVVENDGEVIAEMPYSLHRKGLWRISTQPPLTRTLGPVIKPAKKPTDQEWRRRIGIAGELIAKLPSCAVVQQTLDTRIAEAVAFALQGFTVSASFTLKIPPGRSEEHVWTDMRANTRNVIRRAAERLTAREMHDPDRFVDFYDANLERRKRGNVYGSRMMRELLGEVLKRKAGMLLGAFAADGSLAAEIALVWDKTTMYYLLSSRAEDSHSGSIALLLWIAIRAARERDLTFDFDGIPNMNLLTFLSGFGGTPAQRLMVERIRGDYAVMRTIRRSARRYVTGEA